MALTRLVMETISFLSRFITPWYEMWSIPEAIFEGNVLETSLSQRDHAVVFSAEGLSKATVKGSDVLRIGVDIALPSTLATGYFSRRRGFGPSIGFRSRRGRSSQLKRSS